MTFLCKDGKIKKRKSVRHSSRVLQKCQTDATVACHQLWMYSHPLEPATKTSQVQFTVTEAAQLSRPQRLLWAHETKEEAISSLDIKQRVYIFF